MVWFVYIVRCSDDTLYTGITTDVSRRVAEHNGEGKALGAKYTKARRPVQLVYQKKVADKSTAAQEEYRIRTLPRVEKNRLTK
jgi:putative endonuclease